MMKRSHVLASSLIVAAVGIIALNVATGNAQAPGASQAPAPAAAPAAQAPAGAGSNPAPLPPALTSCPELAAAVRIVAASDREIATGRISPATGRPTARWGRSTSCSWAIRSPTRGRRRGLPRILPGQALRGARHQRPDDAADAAADSRQDVLNLKPKAVVILAGTNDISQQHRAGNRRRDRGQPRSRWASWRPTPASRSCSRASSRRAPTTWNPNARAADLAPPAGAHPRDQ